MFFGVAMPLACLWVPVQMPRMDGLEATRRICAEHVPERRPYIVGMTAQALASNRDECLEVGMDDYVTKPIDLEALLAALQRAQTRTTQKWAVNTN